MNCIMSKKEGFSAHDTYTDIVRIKGEACTIRDTYRACTVCDPDQKKEVSVSEWKCSFYLSDDCEY